MMYLLPFLENYCTYNSLKIKNSWFIFSSNFELLELLELLELFELLNYNSEICDK